MASSRVRLYPGQYAAEFERGMRAVVHDRVIDRIWALDHTVWSTYPDEILNRLGWLHFDAVMKPELPRIDQLGRDLHADGITQVVWLGMGGASLAADVFRIVYREAETPFNLHVLDSTHPAALSSLAAHLDLKRTVFVFSMKKWALETYSLLTYWWHRVRAVVGAERVGRHFIALTDPGAWVPTLAEQHSFRATILNDPNIGGRYAALSYVGLLPAALVGADIDELMSRAAEVRLACQMQPADNPGAQIGVLLGELAQQGIDKLTCFASAPVAGWLDWVEQLIAESLGKAGVGIVPVVHEPVIERDTYGEDRVFVWLQLGDDMTHAPIIERLTAAGRPVIHLRLRDLADLGGQFFLWMFAVAVAGQRLGVQPFDQPNVEATKQQTARLLDAYRRDGVLPTEPAASVSDLNIFLDQAAAGDYIVLAAYLPPDSATHHRLHQLRRHLLRRTGCAATGGYGPRYLHSTGQLHKGDAGRGLFILLTADHRQDYAVPLSLTDETADYTFGTLIDAQALGDLLALRTGGRRVLRLHLSADIPAALDQLIDRIAGK